MALNKLLWYCLNQGTSLREQNVGVSISPNKKGDLERIVFFKIDSPGFRRYFGVDAKTQLCDGLVFYRRDGMAPIFIFVELKSDDISEAEDQIESAYRIVFAKVPKDLKPPAIFRGLVVLRASVPTLRRHRKRSINITLRSGRKGKSTDLRDCDVLD